MRKFIFIILLFVNVEANSQFFRRIIAQTNPVTLVGVETLADIYVPNGTAFGSINFSDYSLDEASAINSDSEFMTVDISWQAGSYNGNVSANYTLSGTITGYSLPGITNPLSITASIVVHVVTLESEYQTLLNRGTTLGYTLPTPICQGFDNQLMITIKTLSMDVFHCYETDGSKEFATLNWKSPTTNQATLVSTPTFTSRIGFTSNGSSSYINTNFNPSAGTSYTQNNSSFGVYVPNSDELKAGASILGVVATGARLNLGWTKSTRAVIYEINGNTNPTILNTSPFGLYHVWRTSSTQVNVYSNNCFLATGTADNSVARPNGNVYIGARNNAGTADLFSAIKVGCFWAGAALNASITTLYNAWNTRHIAIRPKIIFSSPTQIGTIVNDTFARASLGGDYATTAGTWSLDGTKMTVSGGASTPNVRLLYKYGHSAEKWTLTATVKITSAIGATTSGIGLGPSDYSGANGQRSLYCSIDLSTGANAGKAIIYTYDGTTNSQVGISSTAIPSISQNDQFNVTVQKSIVTGQFQYDITVVRVSDNATVTAQFRTSFGESTGDFAMWNLGGAAQTIEVTAFSASIQDNKHERICFVGNSLTHGILSTTTNTRYVALAYPSSYSVSGGSGDRTEDVYGSSATIIGKIQNLLDYNAHYYLLIIGGNDIAGGVSATTWQNNLKKIANALMGEGRKVFFASPFARELAANVGAYYTFTSVEWPNNLSTNQTFTDTKNTSDNQLKAIYDSGDGVHMNDLGHSVGANAISVNLPILY